MTILLVNCDVDSDMDPVVYCLTNATKRPTIDPRTAKEYDRARKFVEYAFMHIDPGPLHVTLLGNLASRVWVRIAYARGRRMFHKHHSSPQFRQFMKDVSIWPTDDCLNCLLRA